jgi:hypothetical protein
VGAPAARARGGFRTPAPPPPPPPPPPPSPFAPQTLFSENERLGLRNKGERGQMGFMQKCGLTATPASFTHPPLALQVLSQGLLLHGRCAGQTCSEAHFSPHIARALIATFPCQRWIRSAPTASTTATTTRQPRQRRHSATSRRCPPRCRCLAPALCCCCCFWRRRRR